jgi:hypothetical protein
MQIVANSLTFVLTNLESAVRELVAHTHVGAVYYLRRASRYDLESFMYLISSWDYRCR